MQGVGNAAFVERLQRCFCMDIQRFKRDSAKASITHNSIGHYYTTNTSNKYKLNLNYVTIIKHNIDKLLTVGFIEFVKEATWLSCIIVVPKKNGKWKICIDLKKLNTAIKKDPYPLPFTDEVLNIVAWYEAYSFLDGYSRYHQISIALEDILKNKFNIN